MDGDDLDDVSLASGDRRENETEEEAKTRKRKERLEQNRISARESRKRKKSMIEELQRTVITLSRENKDLNDRNESLRRQLMEIGGKYPNIVPLQTIVGQGAARAPSQADQSAAAAAASVATAGVGDESTITQMTAASANGATIETEAANYVGSSFSAFNSMSWLSSPTPAPVADPTANIVDSSNQTNV